MKYMFLLTVLTAFAFSKNRMSPPDYVQISGKITNAKSKELIIHGRMGFKKTIAIREDGSFRDTMKISKGPDKLHIYMVEDLISTSVYLENGSEVELAANANDFDNTLNFKLDFADYNNYMNANRKVIGSLNKSWYREDQVVFDEKIKSIKKQLSNSSNLYPNISEDKIKNELSSNLSIVARFSDKFEEEHKLASKLKRGAISPDFVDYEHYNGTKVSLSDLKGKYVYIDVWATWCAPCRAQVPSLKKVSEKYKGKNIEFVSISVDDEKDYDKWREMVKEEELPGTQLFADNAFKSDFVQAYGIKGIPRFILINPAGEILDFDAPRPSETERLEDLFLSLGL